jgi:hypothetical protein
MGLGPKPAFALTPLLPGPQIMDMDAPPLRPRPVSPRPHWTDPVPREETLAVREKFRKVGWRQPNHKPSTTKIVAWAKSLWDRYVTRGYVLHTSGIRVRVSDGIFSGIVSISGLILIDTY